MDGRGGCCIARYATGASDHMSTMDRIMLRFRPIAPKPVTAADGSSSESGGGDALFPRGGRGSRRKYVRKNSNNKRRKTVSSPEQNRDPAPVVTLPLLPETPDRKDSPARDGGNRNSDVPASAGWLSFENGGSKMETIERPYWWCGGGADADPTSCVTVECVTDAWVEGGGLGRTDEERRLKLSEDTCPGFISDGYGRVTWTNGAYNKMVVGRESRRDEGKTVMLVMKVGYGVMMMYPSFTCRVRVVQLEWGKERSSLTVPCDVWRMDCGGFAWRLDVKAALSLRLGSC